MATNGSIDQGAEAGFGRAVFNLNSDSTRADGINNTLSNFATGYKYAETSSAGADGALISSLHPSLQNRVYHINAANGGNTLIISQPMTSVGGTAIGNAAGLYVTPSGAFSGTRWYSSTAGDHQLSSTAASALASTEGGALYQIGSTVHYINEAGVGTSSVGATLGSASAVVGGGALISLGANSYYWNDAAGTLTAIDDKVMTAAVAFGDDALFQTADGFQYFDSSDGSVSLLSASYQSLEGGITAGDFALVTLDTGGTKKAHFFKDTGAGTKIDWVYGTMSTLEFDGVGGYAAIPEPATLGMLAVGGAMVWIRRKFMV